MKIETKTYEQAYRDEQRAGAITLIYLGFVLGIFMGLSFGLWQVSRAKDVSLQLIKDTNIQDVIYDYKYSEKVRKEGEAVDKQINEIPKNLPKITALKGI